MTTQFLPGKEQVAAWTDAARLRESQVRQAISDLADRTRTRCEKLPGEVVEEIRRRINVLDLATRADVETVSKLGRSRVSFVLKEFLEAQQGRDEALLRSVRSEIREQLESFAAVIDDDLFADIPATTGPARRAPKPPPVEIDFLDDEDDDQDDEERGLVEYYGMRLRDDEYDEDEFDLADGMGRPTA
jgi:hypothetical protein